MSTGSDDSSDPAVAAAADLFDALGLDTDLDDELDDTPQRFVELLRTAFDAVGSEPPSMSTFPADETRSARDPVILAQLPFHSMCVHHVVPFFGHIDVAYIPGDTMTGFGSVSRVIDHFAHRPQIQEQLVDQIARHLDHELDPRGVLVRCVARQMCMEMRGAKKRGRLVSSASRGVLTDGRARIECIEQFEGSSSQ